MPSHSPEAPRLPVRPLGYGNGSSAKQVASSLGKTAISVLDFVVGTKGFELSIGC
jgi:hypothetical protein